MSKKHSSSTPSNQAAVQTAQEPVNAPVLLEETFKGKADLIFLALAGLIGFVVFKDFLLFNKLFLFKDIGSDTSNFNYPNLVEYNRLLTEQGHVGWSFARGMGQNMYPNAYNDMFNVILYMIGAKNMVWYMGWIEFVKVILGGWFFLRFLSLTGAGSYTSVIGGLLYSFSGYMIVGGSWYVFSTSAVLTSCFFWTFELVFQEKRYWPFALSSGFLAFFSPVIFFVTSVALGVYYLFRYFSNHEFVVAHFAKKSLVIALLGLIGLIIGAANWLPSLTEMMLSPRGAGTASYTKLLHHVGSASSQSMTATSLRLQ